jgi:NTE family protein
MDVDRRRRFAAVLARKPWTGQFDPLSGVVLHEAKDLAALAD